MKKWRAGSEILQAVEKAELNRTAKFDFARRFWLSKI
jgi:hypothetical protein